MEYTKIIKIFVVVVLILAITYFATAIATGEIKFGKKKETEKEETNIQYEEIIAGQVLNRKDSEYYVLCFDFTDTFSSYYLSLKDSYTEKEDSLPVYILDLEKSFNQEIVLEEGEDYQQKPSNVSNLKVNNPTLLKIKDHRVTERITGTDDILKFFES